MKTASWMGGILLGTALTGCGGSGYVPVQGTVTLDGQPLPAAALLFSPTSKDGRPAIAMSDQDGRFSLTTRKDGDGALPGKYAVGVTKSIAEGVEMKPPDPSQALPPPADLAKTKEMADKALEARRKSGIPEMYWNATTSGIAVEIPAGGDKNLEIKLDSKAVGGK